MAFSSSTTSTSTLTARLQPPPSRSLRRPSATASTPNLNSAYAAQTPSAHVPTSNIRVAPAALARKTSLATLTTSSLASIPDASESYALNSVLTDAQRNMAPATPGRLATPAGGGPVSVGDVVEVPGNMMGTVRFVGSVQGKNGVFAGVELLEDFAARGKNNGDVDGVSYFSTVVPGAGIFLPVAKAVRRDSPGRPSYGSIPQTPTTREGFKHSNQNNPSFTPPTPGLPKLFSASVGPGARAPSPQGKRPPRTSLPRPDSPVRRQQMTPGPRPAIATPAKTPARYGSPTNRFAQSVRGTAGDPAKKGSKLDRMPNLGPRSASALGSASGMDDDSTPTGRPPANGNFGSVSSFNSKMRPPSRNNVNNMANEEELERLRAQLEERDRQFREQAANLSEMEQSLTELQTLMESSENMSGQKGELDDKDSRQLKAIIREKNEKIAMLTAEFDAHRADFRSTIDTLEMASTETERVYEKRIEELMGELRELESRNLDVDSVANQLKQLEELVQELEEGLEDARRGEAEARGEVEFLRGEVERTRTELRREREKAGSPSHGGSGDPAALKELEQKEDEIRGLKAIIHSLSRDSIPSAEDRKPTQGRGSLIMNGDSVENKIARDNLERQVAELQSLLEKKSGREEELERELDAFRNGNGNGNSNGNHRDSARNHRSSLRDSRDTVILSRAQEARSPEAVHKRTGILDSMPESDSYSTATENSTLWCEICETSGHDILTCTNMFGSEVAAAAASKSSLNGRNGRNSLKDSAAAPAPLSHAKSKPVRPVSPAIKIMPNPMESGPVAGKESGIMDPEKWCAVCERDGHDSVDCPFEDAF